MSHKHLLFVTLAAASAAVALVSCGGKEEPGLHGTIKGAREGSFAALETTDQFGLWYCVDSAEINAKGEFFIPFKAPDAPEIYRLRYDGRYLYMPVDSITDLTLTADAANFGKGFTLTGSPLADSFTAFERDAQRVEALADPDSTEALKLRTYNNYIANSKGDILSYYILTRAFGDGHLIEYTDPLYTAVANGFQTYRPDDPHTAALVKRAVEGQAQRRKERGQTSVFKTQQIAMIDIDLPDMQGVKRKLSDVAGKGKPTVLVFAAMGASDTPALNRALRTLYDEGKADIYEVCYDKDHLVMANGSKGLPWTVVQDPDGVNSHTLLQYNVGALPTMFIYDSRGELQQRAATVEELRKLMANID